MSSSYTPGRDSGESNDQNRDVNDSQYGSGREPVEREPIEDQPTTQNDQVTGQSASDDVRTRTFDRRDVSAQQGSSGTIQGERDPGGTHRLDPDDDGRTGVGPGRAGGAVINRENNFAREKEVYGGIKFGSAFFGWLVAAGMTVLLSALVAAITAGVGAATNTEPGQAIENPQAAGIWGIVVLLVVLLVAYYSGGYVAGRMARFSGVKQGLAVWLWALIIAIIAALVGAIAGAQMGALNDFATVPEVNVDQGMMTTAGIITLVGVIVVTLGGALLGGVAGMRFHRKVDRAGFDPDNDPYLDRR